MSEACNHDCSSCGKECSSRGSGKADFIEVPHPLSSIRRVIGVVSGKGGVGKSMVTSMLAVLAQRMGYRTAVLDADITGPSIPTAFGLHTLAQATEDGIYPVRSKTGIEVISLNLLLENETDPVVWRGPVIAGVVKQFWAEVIWQGIDLMFIDMPPGTGDVPLTVFQSIPVDGIVVVTTPQQLVGMIVEKAVNMAAIMGIPVLALVENMGSVICPECKAQHFPFGQGRAEAVARRHGIPLTAHLPIDPQLATACDTGMIELFSGTWLDGLAEIFK